ncbi:hypothetical protein JTE90_005755 [Oedothorax gibbosus]|uniref:(S)-2-hydroxy-acid oxidase n=1 Tax=Oedothorax gibbosus TaxID=931172 RepID=A0AAV6UTM4_9ARAC|nr:hypothetical protein JTE90_005755 [Oedothorax gibbosus]
MDALRVVKDFEKYALEEKMSPNAKMYFSAGAISLTTPRYNEEALNRYMIRPRVLRDVSNVQTDCQLLGAGVSFPIGISPVALHQFAHPEGELATVRGSCKEDCVFVLSTASSTKLEDVAKAAFSVGGHAEPKIWMQVYIHKDRNITLDLIRKAESSGFSAIVITVDSPNSGLWRNVFHQQFFETCKPMLANLPCLMRYLEEPALTFEDLKWLKQNTKLPVIVKGILSGEDAWEAANCGASAIFVSNHGGRLIERVVPTIEVLEEVVEAVGDTGVEVYVDGGIRSGTDIFVCLALGARAVFVGRPAVWGLAADGEDGVRRILQILKQEFLFTMQLAGASKLEDINKNMIVKM